MWKLFLGYSRGILAPISLWSVPAAARQLCDSLFRSEIQLGYLQTGKMVRENTERGGLSFQNRISALFFKGHYTAYSKKQFFHSGSWPRTVRIPNPCFLCLFLVTCVLPQQSTNLSLSDSVHRKKRSLC